MVNVLDKVQPKNKEQLKQLINYTFKHDIYDLNFIDISEITDMSMLFRYSDYNFDVSDWDVSNVTDMNNMFYCCNNFNCDLSNWDMSNTLRINEMFYGCKNFEGKGLENWKLEKTLFYYNIFAGCDKVKLPSWYKAFLKRCNLEFV